jgi:hypothetical protein
MTDGDSEELHAEEPVAKKKLIGVIAPPVCGATETPGFARPGACGAE